MDTQTNDGIEYETEDFHASRVEKVEEYKDKDREAAVLLGNKVIKTSLVRRKKRDVQKLKPEIRTSETLFQQGRREMKNGKYANAIKCFDTVLEILPKDQKCLTYRSKCHLLLGKNEQALKDIEEAMKINPNNFDSIEQIAETLYLFGNFEHALIYFQRGHQLRSDNVVFKLGIQKCHEAINNSIGAHAPFELTAPEISETGISSKQNDIFTKSFEEVVDIEEVEKREKISRLLLEKAEDDRLYLNDLLMSKELIITKKNSKSICHIRNIIKETLTYLKTREEFWRKQQPIYSRNLGGKLRVFDSKMPKDLTPKKKTEMKKIVRDDMIKLLKEIDSYLVHGHYNISLTKCKDFLKILNSYYGRKLDNKNEITAAVFSQMGTAYFELKNYKVAIHYFQKDLNMATECNLTYAKSIALENLGRAYAASKDYNNAIETWKQKIPLCKEKIEETWLYHEIGRAYLETGFYEQAIEYGKKAIKCATKCYNLEWKLNCTALVAQAYAFTKNIEEAIKYFKSALSYAKLLSNSKMMETIQEMLSVLQSYNENQDVQPSDQELEMEKLLESSNFPFEDTTEEESYHMKDWLKKLCESQKSQIDVKQSSTEDEKQEQDTHGDISSIQSIEHLVSDVFIRSDDDEDKDSRDAVSPENIKYHSTPIKKTQEDFGTSEIRASIERDSPIQPEFSAQYATSNEISDFEKSESEDRTDQISAEEKTKKIQ